MDVALTLAVVFFASFQIIKLLTEYLLKRRLIRDNQIDKAIALSQFNTKNNNESSYPTLKWGLVALFGGVAFILIEILSGSTSLNMSMEESFLPIGVILVFVSIAFLLYFFIARNKDAQ